MHTFRIAVVGLQYKRPTPLTSNAIREPIRLRLSAARSIFPDSQATSCSVWLEVLHVTHVHVVIDVVSVETVETVDVK